MVSEESADENIFDEVFDEADDSTCADDELNLSHQYGPTKLLLLWTRGTFIHQLQEVLICGGQ